MCHPAVLAVGTMGLKAYGGWQAGKSARAKSIADQNYYNYMADQNKINAEQALKEGKMQEGIIATQEKEQGKALKKTQARFSGEQIAQMASQGVDLSSVMAENIASDTFTTQREDELALRYNADLKKWGVVRDASIKDWQFRSRAEQARFAGRYARWAGKLKERAIYAKTAVSMLGSAMSFGSSGMFSGGAGASAGGGAQMSYIGGGSGPAI